MYISKLFTICYLILNISLCYADSQIQDFSIIEENVDVIEHNIFIMDNFVSTKKVYLFSQIVYWRDGRVIDWRPLPITKESNEKLSQKYQEMLTKKESFLAFEDIQLKYTYPEMLPEKINNRWVSIFVDRNHNQLRRISAKAFIRNWSNDDSEVLDRKFLDQNDRPKLLLLDRRELPNED